MAFTIKKHVDCLIQEMKKGQLALSFMFRGR